MCICVYVYMCICVYVYMCICVCTCYSIILHYITATSLHRTILDRCRPGSPPAAWSSATRARQGSALSGRPRLKDLTFQIEGLESWKHRLFSLQKSH